MLSNLNVLQSLYNAARLEAGERLDDAATTQLLMIATNLVDVLRNYAERLDMPAPCKYNPSLEHKNISDAMARPLKSASVSEKLVYERQILAVIALFVSDYAHIGESLLFDRMDTIQLAPAEIEVIDVEYGKESFIEALIEVLHRIGCSVSKCKNVAARCAISMDFAHASFVIFATEIRSISPRSYRIVVHIACGTCTQL